MQEQKLELWQEIIDSQIKDNEVEFNVLIKILGEDDFIEIANSDIICSILTNCTFGNIKFKECSFIGCKFYECNFESGGVLFENCTFF